MFTTIKSLFTALFEDGDIPGERMFSFQQRQTPTSKKRIIKSGKNHHDNKDDREIFKISPRGRYLFYYRIYII